MGRKRKTLHPVDAARKKKREKEKKKHRKERKERREMKALAEDPERLSSEIDRLGDEQKRGALSHDDQKRLVAMVQKRVQHEVKHARRLSAHAPRVGTPRGHEAGPGSGGVADEAVAARAPPPGMPPGHLPPPGRVDSTGMPPGYPSADAFRPRQHPRRASYGCLPPPGSLPRPSRIPVGPPPFGGPPRAWGPPRPWGAPAPPMPTPQQWLTTRAGLTARSHVATGGGRNPSRVGPTSPRKLEIWPHAGPREPRSAEGPSTTAALAREGLGAHDDEAAKMARIAALRDRPLPAGGTFGPTDARPWCDLSLPVAAPPAAQQLPGPGPASNGDGNCGYISGAIACGGPKTAASSVTPTVAVGHAPPELLRSAAVMVQSGMVPTSLRRPLREKKRKKRKAPKRVRLRPEPAASHDADFPAKSQPGRQNDQPPCGQHEENLGAPVAGDGTAHLSPPPPPPLASIGADGDTANGGDGDYAAFMAEMSALGAV